MSVTSRSTPRTALFCLKGEPALDNEDVTSTVQVDNECSGALKCLENLSAGSEGLIDKQVLQEIMYKNLLDACKRNLNSWHFEENQTEQQLIQVVMLQDT